MSKITIYALIHPITEEIRYIGRTTKKLSRRLSEHICESKANHGTHKRHWIKKLKNEGLVPKIIPLKELDCTWEESYEIEQSIISEYLIKGFKLTNLQDKGAGLIIKCVYKIGQKSVLQYSLDGNFIKEFISLTEAASAVNGRLKGIHKALNICNTGYGFQWRYKTINYPLKIDKIVRKQMDKRKIKIVQLTLDGEIIKIWDSASDAVKFFKDHNITSVCRGRQKTCKGFKWKYLKE